MGLLQTAKSRLELLRKTHPVAVKAKSIFIWSPTITSAFAAIVFLFLAISSALKPEIDPVIFGIYIASFIIMTRFCYNLSQLESDTIPNLLRIWIVISANQIAIFYSVDLSECINSFASFIFDYPKNSLIILICVLSLLCAFELIVPIRYKQSLPAHISYGACAISIKSKKYDPLGPWSNLNKWEAELMASHEAGHAIVLGLLPYLENRTTVALQTLHPEEKIDGFCTFHNWRSRIGSMAFMELRMLILVAGVEAEKLCEGDRSISGYSDYETWLHLAKEYLSRSDNVIYYQKPSSDLEFNINHRLISELRERNISVVKSLLEKNKDILLTIRRMLIEEGVITGLPLISLLSNVIPVDGCPLFTDKFNDAIRSDIEKEI